MCEVLDQVDWTQRREAHRKRVATILGPYRQRRSGGGADPVVDFLFTYYTLRPGQLERWHPGFGVVLNGHASVMTGYTRTDQGITVDPKLLLRRHATIEFVAGLLEATAGRAPYFGCFGLHEWAMVYRSRADDARHRGVPLRLGAAGTDAVVESLPLRCTHFDAFRFFTDAARPRNNIELTRQAQPATEQPGCVHAAMDLYKWGVKLLPLIDSGVLLDAFELAYDARVLDMSASPYDLREFGYRPICVESASGRAEYVREQAAIAERAAKVRQALIARCRTLAQWSQ